MARPVGRRLGELVVGIQTALKLRVWPVQVNVQVYSEALEGVFAMKVFRLWDKLKHYQMDISIWSLQYLQFSI